jgi:uncharacterized membrane protein YkvA (DUF1232 family)
MLSNLKTLANLLKQELSVYRLLLKDRRTPTISKIFLGVAVGYAILPFDLIPDWIPVIGHLDDLIVVPALVLVSLKFIPDELVQECRSRVYVGLLAL